MDVMNLIIKERNMRAQASSVPQSALPAIETASIIESKEQASSEPTPQPAAKELPPIETTSITPEGIVEVETKGRRPKQEDFYQFGKIPEVELFESLTNELRELVFKNTILELQELVKNFKPGTALILSLVLSGKIYTVTVGDSRVLKIGKTECARLNRILHNPVGRTL
jgi:hypothetical protein